MTTETRPSDVSQVNRLRRRRRRSENGSAWAGVESGWEDGPAIEAVRGPIRVLVGDGHGVMGGALAQLLDAADGFELAGSATDGAQAVTLTFERSPDVVLVDVSMPVLDGIEATRRITAASPSTKVVFLTSSTGRAQVLEAIDAGAAGYLLSDCGQDELLRGIAAAARGECPLAPRAANVLLAERVERRLTDLLSGREWDVLVLLAHGMPNKQIARRLEISEKTVKTHLTRVFRKIGVADRTQAALWAQRHGFVGGSSA